MIPHLRSTRTAPVGHEVYDFLHRGSFAKINHPDSTNIQWPTLSGGGLPIGMTTINRAAQQLWDVGDNWEIGTTFRSLTNTLYNRFLENDYFEWNSSRNSRWLGAYSSKRITDVTTLTLPGSGRMFSPVRRTAANNWQSIYIHSKLALFDDQWLALGTANFTYRSMNYDGEITVFINNPTIATNARTALFNHWQSGNVPPPIPATFNGQANTAAGCFTANIATPGTYVVPLTLNDFWAHPPTGREGWLNYTFY
jgi:phosphatidylserine/phosphatidylglycerophosphate/cardiolipin synthase-like enzyme